MPALPAAPAAAWAACTDVVCHPEVGAVCRSEGSAVFFCKRALRRNVEAPFSFLLDRRSDDATVKHVIPNPSAPFADGGDGPAVAFDLLLLFLRKHWAPRSIRDAFSVWGSAACTGYLVVPSPAAGDSAADGGEEPAVAFEEVVGRVVRPALFVCHPEASVVRWSEGSAVAFFTETLGAPIYSGRPFFIRAHHCGLSFRADATSIQRGICISLSANTNAPDSPERPFFFASRSSPRGKQPSIVIPRSAWFSA